MLTPSRVVLGLVGCLASASCSSSTSVEPNVLNLHASVPLGWSTVGTNSPTYVVGTDNVTVHDGNAALAIAGTDSAITRFAGVGQFIRADNYRGKRVRFSAWVRQANIIGNDTGLWMRVDGPGVMLGFDNFFTRPLRGTSGWHSVEIILDVPDNAIGIAFGALMSAKGELFVDDLRFDVVPATGPTTNQLTELTSSGADSATTAAAYAGRGAAPINLSFEAR
jgi:hypothetical protein